MTTFSVVLFLHLLGALFLFMAFAVEWVILGRVRSCTSLEQARPWLMAGKPVPLLGAIGGIGVLIPGLFLAAHEVVWAQAWIQAAITTSVVIALLGVIITGPRMRALAKAAQEAVPGAAQGTGQTGSSALRRLRDPAVVFSLRFRALIAVGVLYLMAAKPGTKGTIVATAISYVLGVLISIPALSHREA
ncbi:MAG: hypothetical protein WA871_06680 [Candidatus Acidiferrales bacterium]